MIRQRRHHYVDSNHHLNSSGYHSQRYGTLSSHDSSSWHDRQEDDPYFLPSHSHTKRRVSSNAYSSPRRLLFQSSRRPDSCYEMDEGNYHASYANPYPLDEKTSLPYPNYRRQSMYHHESSDYQDYPVDAVTMEDEDDELTPQEAEALRNAELNKVVKAITSAATGTREEHDTFNPPIAEGNTDPPPTSPPAIQSYDTPRPRKKKREGGLVRLASFFRQMRSTKERTKTTKGTIQSMWATAPLGDIMDEQQQNEILAMLQQQPMDGSPTPHKEATKVASLDYIWVFRSTEESMVWTGFDYKNQRLLSQYCEDEKGIEVYDTHIRQGQLPILVIPKRNVCFYAPCHGSDQVASLQVTCLPNSKNTQFVYRCGPVAEV